MKKPFVAPVVKEEASLSDVTLQSATSSCTDPSGCLPV